MLKINYHSKGETPETDILLPVHSKVDMHAFSNILKQSYAISYPIDKLDFEGISNDVQLHYLNNGRRLTLLGVGEHPSFSDLLRIFKSFASRNHKKWTDNLTLDLTFYLQLNESIEESLWVDAAVSGFILGAYAVGKWKSAPEENGLQKAELFIRSASEVAPVGNRAQVLAEAQLGVMDMVNTPGNEKHPSDLAARALTLASEKNVEVHVFDRQELEKMNMHAILAVGKGSDWPPYLIVLSYIPEHSDEYTPHIGLVGKGVTFDTGGISLKNATNLHYMKSDMGGAAAVIGTVEAAARLNLSVKITAVVPAADNAIGARAYRPGDVIGSHSGQTIEVTDTDAEGRLIMADALHYLKVKYQPDVLIDLATLTGSVVRTFGTHCAAFFSNNAQLAAQLSAAGEKTGERLWQLPLWDLYKEDILSDVADLRNFSGKPTAGAISAAKFLESFIDNHPQWAHLDIAGVAYANGDAGNQKSATGFGVRLLIEFIRRYLNK